MKAFTKAVAAAVPEFNPRRFIITSTKAKRAGRIFIDYLRNGRGATCIAPWGLRAKPGCHCVHADQLETASGIGQGWLHDHEPPQNTNEWEYIQPQTVPMAVLRNLGVI